MEVQSTVTGAGQAQTLSAAIRNYLETMFAQGRIQGDNGVNCIYPFSVTPERGRVIAELCRAKRPTATLEIGMAWGASTLLILEALLKSGAHAAPHVVMDPFQSTLFHNAARRAIRKLGLDSLIEFYEEPSELALPRLLGQGRRFDFAFIDGDHRFDAAFTDFRLVHLLLAPGGTILFDDTWLDSVHLTARYAETNLGYEEVPIPTTVPIYRERPMLRAVAKPLKEVARDGIWTEPLKPFFTDLIPQAPQVAAVTGPAIEDARELLGRLDGEVRAARIMMRGGLYELAGASVGRAREAAREIAEVVQLVEQLAALADPALAAEARALLTSVASALVAAQEQRSATGLEDASTALGRLGAIFRSRTP